MLIDTRQSQASRIMLFEHQRSYSDALRLALDITEDLRVVVSDLEPEFAWKRIGELGIDLVVTSNQPLPGWPALEIASSLRGRPDGSMKKAPSVPVVILTAYPTPCLVDAAKGFPNVSVVSKQRPITDVVRAMRSAVRGDRVFLGVNSDPFGLSRAETEVLESLVQGGTATSIAEDLHLSVHAIRARIRGVLVKTGSTSQLEAVSKAIAFGVVAPPSIAVADKAEISQVESPVIETL